MNSGTLKLLKIVRKSRLCVLLIPPSAKGLPAASERWEWLRHGPYQALDQALTAIEQGGNPREPSDEMNLLFTHLTAGHNADCLFWSPI